MVKYGNNQDNIYMRGYTQNNPFQRERKVLGDTIRKIRESKKMT